MKRILSAYTVFKLFLLTREISRIEREQTALEDAVHAHPSLLVYKIPRDARYRIVVAPLRYSSMILNSCAVLFLRSTSITSMLKKIPPNISRTLRLSTTLVEKHEKRTTLRMRWIHRKFNEIPFLIVYVYF